MLSTPLVIMMMIAMSNAHSGKGFSLLHGPVAGRGRGGANTYATRIMLLLLIQSNNAVCVEAETGEGHVIRWVGHVI